jgi:cytolysin-activating lysine-acyltransferase
MLPDEYHRRLGLAAVAMMASAEYCGYPVACLDLWIRPAILHEQIHFFFDVSGNPVGYVTWALLEQDTEDRFLSDPEVIFHIAEWNGGDRLWITDFVVVNGDLKRHLSETRALFPGVVISSVRRREDGAVRKVTRWRPR